LIFRNKYGNPKKGGVQSQYNKKRGEKNFDRDWGWGKKIEGDMELVKSTLDLVYKDWGKGGGVQFTKAKSAERKGGKKLK